MRSVLTMAANTRMASSVTPLFIARSLKAGGFRARGEIAKASVEAAGTVQVSMRVCNLLIYMYRLYVQPVINGRSGTCVGRLSCYG